MNVMLRNNLATVCDLNPNISSLLATISLKMNNPEKPYLMMQLAACL